MFTTRMAGGQFLLMEVRLPTHVERIYISATPEKPAEPEVGYTGISKISIHAPRSVNIVVEPTEKQLAQFPNGGEDWKKHKKNLRDYDAEERERIAKARDVKVAARQAKRDGTLNKQ